MKTVLSVIYVYYNTPNEIKKSIETLRHSLEKITYEIIIVDNASFKEIPMELIGLQDIRIIKNKENYGYGRGLNQGAKIARGKYLLLVNPDVEFDINSVTKLLNKIDNNPRIGVVGPQLLNKDGEILQSISGAPTLIQGLFTFSFINKIWPHNPFSEKYHNLSLDRNKDQSVDVVSGACVMVKRSLFDKVGGLDERFFMYFEETDFCLRIKRMGYKILYLPKAKVMHLVGKSTQNEEWIEKTFEQSRFKFFIKYHGLIPALVVELVLRLIKPTNLLLLVILSTSVFLGLYKLSERMIFIGDQGWFYISARDMILSGKIPLVGITSSHTWLHQGPIWTYILALILWIFRFNPISGGYFSAFLSTITVFFIYKFGEKIFSRRVGLIAALLYTTSPLIIVNAQMPYHTSPIPLLTLGLIYSVYRWIRGKAHFFPITIFFMGLLYNFELATQIFWFPIMLVFIMGFIKKKRWVHAVFKIRILFISLILFILPMLPILIYDINHEFMQTIKFFVWIPYRVIGQLFWFRTGSLLIGQDKSFVSMLNFFGAGYKNLIFVSNFTVSLLVTFLSVGYLIYFLAATNKTKKDLFSPINILLTFIIVPMIGVFINMTPSGAYLPLFFPGIIIFTAWIFNMIMNKKYLFLPILALIFLIVIGNISFYLDDSKSKQIYGLYFSQRLNAVKTMIKNTHGEKYNIVGKGSGSQFESFTMNYEYLAWWLGNSPVRSPQKLKYIIQEGKSGISLMKNE